MGQYGVRHYDDWVLCWSYSTGSNQCSESERFSSPFHSSNECNGVMDRALTSYASGLGLIPARSNFFSLLSYRVVGINQTRKNRPVVDIPVL